MDESKKAGRKFEQLVHILDTLRSEKGCPWDRDQDERSITNFFLEEVYEAVEAVRLGDVRGLAEELGDVLMEVVFLARIFKEKEEFTISDVLEGINLKMIRRHPHVFGPQKKKSTEEVLEEWKKQKMFEKGRESLFKGIGKYSPALLAAFQIGLRVSSFGFDWDKTLDVVQKLKEEISELEKAVNLKKEDQIFHEMGDVLFSVANVCRHLQINPELALRQANEKFMKRFHYIEKKMRDSGRNFRQATLEEMDAIWNEAKTKIK